MRLWQELPLLTAGDDGSLPLDINKKVRETTQPLHTGHSIAKTHDDWIKKCISAI